MKNFIFFNSLLKRSMMGKKYLHDSTKVKYKSVVPIYPPPGDDLKIPENMTSKDFLAKIGYGCDQYA